MESALADDVFDEPARPLRLDLVATSLIGFAFAALTGAAIWDMYPSRSPWEWPILAVLLGANVLLALVYFTLARTRWLRCADWLVVGYVIGVLAWTTAYATEQAIIFVSHHTASLIGVSVA